MLYFQAASQDEKDAVKALVVPIMQECGKELGVSKEDLLAAKEAKDINAIDPCYYACFFKKTGLVSDLLKSNFTACYKLTHNKHTVCYELS